MALPHSELVKEPQGASSRRREARLALVAAWEAQSTPTFHVPSVLSPAALSSSMSLHTVASGPRAPAPSPSWLSSIPCPAGPGPSPYCRPPDVPCQLPPSTTQAARWLCLILL